MNSGFLEKLDAGIKKFEDAEFKVERNVVNSREYLDLYWPPFPFKITIDTILIWHPDANIDVVLAEIMLKFFNQHTAMMSKGQGLEGLI